MANLHPPIAPALPQGGLLGLEGQQQIHQQQQQQLQQQQQPPAAIHVHPSAYSLTFHPSNRLKQPLMCPAVLRKEGSSVQKFRTSRRHGAYPYSYTRDLPQLHLALPDQQHQQHPQYPRRLRGKGSSRSTPGTPAAAGVAHHDHYFEDRGDAGDAGDGHPPSFLSLPSPTSPQRAVSPSHPSSDAASLKSPASSTGPYISGKAHLLLSSPTASSASGVAKQAKGYMLPRSEWTPDSAVSQCEQDDCSITFGPARPEHATLFGGFTSIMSQPFQSRRHHCRACGKIFCSNHSNNVTALLALDRETFLTATGALTPGTSTPFIGPAGSSRSRPSWRSGASTPSAAPGITSSQDGSYFDGDASMHSAGGSLSSSSSSFANPASAHLATKETTGQVVNSRVCDLCYLSLSLGANLYNPAEVNHPSQFDANHDSLTPQLGLRKLSLPHDAQSQHAIAGPGFPAATRSVPVSANVSPAQSHTLSPHRSMNASSGSNTDSSSAGNSRGSSELADDPSKSSMYGQMSAESLAANSHATTDSVDTHVTTPPTSTNTSPKTRTEAPMKANQTRIQHQQEGSDHWSATETTAAASSYMDCSSSATSSSTAGPQQETDERNDRVSNLSRAMAKTTISRMHPLDPRHGRLSSTDEAASGSNPDSSLEGTIASTPAGWTWSTF